MNAKCIKMQQKNMLVNEYKKNQTSKNSNMISYGSLFSKDKMGHFQILNMNNILIPIILFLLFIFNLHLRIQIKDQFTLTLRWPLYYF